MKSTDAEVKTVTLIIGAWYVLQSDYAVKVKSYWLSVCLCFVVDTQILACKHLYVCYIFNISIAHRIIILPKSLTSSASNTNCLLYFILKHVVKESNTRMIYFLHKMCLQYISYYLFILIIIYLVAILHLKSVPMIALILANT